MPRWAPSRRSRRRSCPGRATAIAIGFAVDLELVALAWDEDVYREGEESRWWAAPHPFAALAEVIARRGAYSRYAHSMAAIWRDLVTPLAADQQALVVGHAGELEAALVACLPDAPHETWGGMFAACEGARLHLEGELQRFGRVELLRL